MKTLVLDNSSWVFLTMLGLNKILIKNFQLITSKEIVDEIKKGVEKNYRDARIRINFIEEKKVKIIEVSRQNLEKVQRETGLKSLGGISVVALAFQEKTILCSDDNRLENACFILDVPLVETISVIFFLHEKKVLNKAEFLELLELLKKFGYNEVKIFEAIKLLEGLN